ASFAAPAAAFAASPVALAASSIFLPAVSAGPRPVSERQPAPTSATPPVSTSTVASRFTVRVMGVPFPGPLAPRPSKKPRASRTVRSGTAPEARLAAVDTAGPGLQAGPRDALGGRHPRLMRLPPGPPQPARAAPRRT